MSGCEHCMGNSGRYDDEVEDQWYWCEHCDASERHYKRLREARTPKPRRWEELPVGEQKSHYWAAIPDDEQTIFDGRAYEVVYVYFDGKWKVYRVGQREHEPLSAFRFLFKVNLQRIGGNLE